MNVSSFFDHWSIIENPFQAEEARHDAVFARLGGERVRHPDFEKILGDTSRPSSAIVFGEKGSGKTAIRLQIERSVSEHNARRPNERILLTPYDDLNAALDRFVEAAGRREDGSPLDALKRFTLSDHMDSILHAATIRIVDALLEDPRGDPQSGIGRDEAAALRKSPPAVRRDLMTLQAVYDRPADATARTARLRRLIRAPRGGGRTAWDLAVALGWIPAAGAFALDRMGYIPDFGVDSGRWLFFVLAALWVLVVLKWALVDVAFSRWTLGRLSRRVAAQLRTLGRSAESLAASLGQLPKEDRLPQELPLSQDDDARYEMFARLGRVQRAMGFSAMMIVIDRLDEPMLISGDPERMKAVAWPLLNNKFLQMTGFGLKMLLPIELRHALFRESSAFFQEARLDKQNLIEQLRWTGSTLYDLCNARLHACLAEGAERINLIDLFDDETNRQDVVDALDQMQQPRDAFKLLYRCVQEHCSNVTDEAPEWRIPRLTLEHVRKQQAERVQLLFRGVRPG